LEFAIDKSCEIISNISDIKNIDDDDGLGALNISLQSAMWSCATMKKKNDNKVNKLNIYNSCLDITNRTDNTETEK
jgi:hypothetical protein